jgi:predicted transcriptional regulator
VKSQSRTLDIDLEIANRGIPTSWHGIYRRALAGSRPAAVKALCGECQGWEDGARQAIRDCPSVGCPLHAVRPFQKKAGNALATPDDDIDDESGGESSDDSRELANAIRASLEMEAKGRQQDRSLGDVKAKILDHLYRKGESQRAYIIFATGIPESLWNEAIRSLVDSGEVEREGEKRNTRYRLKDRRIK